MKNLCQVARVAIRSVDTQWANLKIQSKQINYESNSSVESDQPAINCKLVSICNFEEMIDYLSFCDFHTQCPVPTVGWIGFLFCHFSLWRNIHISSYLALVCSNWCDRADGHEILHITVWCLVCSAVVHMFSIDFLLVAHLRIIFISSMHFIRLDGKTVHKLIISTLDGYLNIESVAIFRIGRIELVASISQCQSSRKHERTHIMQFSILSATAGHLIGCSCAGSTFCGV